MSYVVESRNEMEFVEVEWVDICVAQNFDDVGVAIRFTRGWMLDRKFWSKDVPCYLIASTWDEEGWADFCTLPHAVVREVTVCES